MKKYLSYIILALTGLVLGTYIWFGEIKQGQHDQQALEDTKKLFTLPFNTIGSVAVRYAYDTYTLSRVARGEWLFTAPMRAVADQRNVARYIHRILSLEKKGRIAHAETRLDEFGLAHPEITVTFMDEAGKEAGRISFGNTNPSGDFAYVRCDDDTLLYLIDNKAMVEVRKTAADLRDRNLCSIDREAIQQLEILHGEKAVMLQKGAGGYWRIIAPIQALARQQVIEPLLDKLAYSKAQFFIDGPHKDYTAFGLANPRFTVHAWNREKQMSTLMLGSLKKGGDTFYARRLESPSVILVDKYVAASMSLTLATIRDSVLVALQKNDITGLAVTSSHGEFKWHRDSTHVWQRQYTDGRASETVPGGVFDEILEALVRLPYTHIVTDTPSKLSRYGLEHAALQVTIFGRNGVLERLSFGTRMRTSYYCTLPAGHSVYKVAHELPDKVNALCKKSALKE